MNHIMKASKDMFQKVVDKNHGKRVDIAGAICYSLCLLVAMYCIYGVVQILWYPILKTKHSSFFYTIFILLPTFTFYTTMAGEYFKKPSRRVQQFFLVIVTTSCVTLAYIVQIANTSFVGMLRSINNIEVIPYSLLEGNIRMVSLFIPCAIVLPVITLTFKVIMDRQIKKELIEYEVEFLIPNVHKMDDTTIDIKICEDLQTGEDCIVPEKTAYEHFFLQGGTGSGKTATYIRPYLGQLFYMKGYLREMEKKLAFEALNEGIAYLAAPITNTYFAKNFTMDLIKPVQGKENEFKEKFKRFIIGTRDKESLLVDKVVTEGTVAFKKPKNDSNCIIKVTIFEHGMEFAEKEIKFKGSEVPTEIVIKEGLKAISINQNIQGGLGLEVRNELDEVVTSAPDLEDGDELILSFPPLQNGFTYQVTAHEKGAGEIIYKGLGVTVVAPDGGLPKDTLKIAKEYSVKVHKIDPVMEEIRKGGIARFNPLLGDSPEKTGDIISSILVSMEQTNGQDSNPYFTNASVRAVRNITILIKVMYPRLKGINPTLQDILDILNNFNLVVPIVNEMKKDEALKKRWSSVISYFESSFFPPEMDDKGRPIAGATIGSQRKKTEEAIGGIINQLDNFLGREEIKYILCDRKDSLDLAEVLEKGECIAIATRQNDLGERLGKAFALMFILSMQNVVLSRYSEDENPEVPHYLIIDEFPFYVNDSTKVFFTFARKYRTSVCVAIQNMAQLKEVSDVFRETIFTNTGTKILLPKSNVEDREYWSKFFGIEEAFEMKTGVSQSALMTTKPSYSESKQGTLAEKSRVTEQDINDMNFKQAFYCYTDSKGRQQVGKGLTDFFKIDENSKIEIGEFDFQQFNRESISEYAAREKVKKDVVHKRVETTADSTFNEGVVSTTTVSGFEPIEEKIDIDTIPSELEIPKVEINTGSSSEDIEKIDLDLDFAPKFDDIDEVKTETKVNTVEPDIVYDTSDPIEAGTNINIQVQGALDINTFDIDSMELEGAEESISPTVVVEEHAAIKENEDVKKFEKVESDDEKIDLDEVILDETPSVSEKTIIEEIEIEETNNSEVIKAEENIIEETTVEVINKNDEIAKSNTESKEVYFDLDLDFEVKGVDKWVKK